VQEAAVPQLIVWDNFYVIVGSASAGLTGLMFIVITLLAGTRRRGSSEATASFSTPTVVHFCIALLVAALLSAPWQALAPPSLLLGLTGLAGVAYSVVVLRRTRRQTAYTPVLEDWLFHVILPLVAYAALIVAALLLPGAATLALYGIGAVTLLLLFVGIHNAWDNVTYIALEILPRNERKEDEQKD
jgi:hypothetical protein